jgi:hypothetical protein
MADEELMDFEFASDPEATSEASTPGPSAKPAKPKKTPIRDRFYECPFRAKTLRTKFSSSKFGHIATKKQRM